MENENGSEEVLTHRTTREYHRYMVDKFGDETARGALRRYLQNRGENLAEDDVAYIRGVLDQEVQN